jgi:hypothetical protein
MTDPTNPRDDDAEAASFDLPQSELIGVVSGQYMRVRSATAEVAIYKKREYDARALAAVDFVSRWGMVAAIPDGMDDAGRQKLRLATEGELVGRAIASVGLLFDAVEDMGWYIDLPDIAEMVNPTDGAQMPNPPMAGEPISAAPTYVEDAPATNGAAPPSVDPDPAATPLAATPENAPQAPTEGTPNATP